ncbi:hypothetical protein [Rhabdochlamydiaceae symbiont of Dictyostelium giganteum]|uniref:hypothetical protein n=1 Tax=Rhabdochlamydiaceae symbiont of Dictyostelium giganteum TaxID=3342349 RepID=UPI00384B9124
MIDPIQQNAPSTASISSNVTADPATDGVNWPYDNSPGALMPDPSDFIIDWNSPNAVFQAQQAYTRLVTWVQNNPASYNGYIMLLQMTVDLSQKALQYPDLLTFLQQPTQLGTNPSLLSTIATYATLSTQINGQDINQFFQQVQSAIGNAAQIPPFDEILTAIQTAAPSVFLVYEQDLQSWVFTDPNTITQIPVTSSSFSNVAANAIGYGIVNHPNDMNKLVNAYYKSEIQVLSQQYQEDPWMLFVILMNLMNQRDQDQGTAITGYSNNLSVISDVNNLISDMLNQISPTQNAAITSDNFAAFFSDLNQVQNIISQNPVLAESILTPLNNAVNSLSSAQITFTASNLGESNQTWSPFDPGTVSWNLPEDTLINFPATSQDVEALTINGIPVQPGWQLVRSTDTITFTPIDANSMSLSLGDVTALGGYGFLETYFSNLSNLSTTVINPLSQPFQNATTSIQALLNSPSSAIQQQIQTSTQMMQMIENFQKAAFDSVINVNQQIMKMIQQSMG